MPLLAESIDDLMDNIESSPVKHSQYNSSDLRIKQEAKPLIKKEVVYDGKFVCLLMLLLSDGRFIYLIWEENIIQSL